VSRSEPNMEVHSSKWQVAGDQRGAAFIALTEHLEEQFGANRRERHIAQLIDDQQLDHAEVLLQSTAGALVTRFHELVNEGGRGREGNTVTLLAGS